MRKLVVICTGLLVLIMVNVSIYQREKLRSDGRMVLLKLAPVDPRSLMQGDYMALNFEIVNTAFPSRHIENGKDGLLVVELDTQGIGQFKRFANTQTLATNEALLRYRVRNNQVKFATNAFFFEEGRAEQYQTARYGEFRVSEQGNMLLINLRSDDLKPL